MASLAAWNLAGMPDADFDMVTKPQIQNFYVGIPSSSQGTVDNTYGELTFSVAQ